MSKSVKSRSTRASYKSGGKPAFDGYTGMEQLREFTFVLGVPGQQQKFLRSKKGVAEHCGKLMSSKIFDLIMYSREADFPEPKEPVGDNVTRGQYKKYEIKMKAVVDKELQCDEHKGRAFRILVGQCHPVMRHKLEAMDDYKDLEKDSDVKELLAMMESLVCDTGKEQYEFWKMAASVRRLVDMTQGQRERV